MAEFTRPRHGTVCWRELQTKDLEKAKEFYKELLGWNLQQSKISPVEYAEIHVGDNAQGGMMELNEGFGEGWEHIPSHWGTYIAVDDCDAAFEAVKANGGQVFCPPFEAPNVGKICMVADPAGAHFSMIEFTK
ncbi:MAG: VOC family protein [Pyrinomonadaceae bacterium]|nr:VOC family protein [Pyrinomonadaceae bacterium]